MRTGQGSVCVDYCRADFRGARWYELTAVPLQNAGTQLQGEKWCNDRCYRRENYSTDIDRPSCTDRGTRSPRPRPWQPLPPRPWRRPPWHRLPAPTVAPTPAPTMAPTPAWTVAPTAAANGAAAASVVGYGAGTTGGSGGRVITVRSWAELKAASESTGPRIVRPGRRRQRELGWWWRPDRYGGRHGRCHHRWH